VHRSATVDTTTCAATTSSTKAIAAATTAVAGAAAVLACTRACSAVPPELPAVHLVNDDAIRILPQHQSGLQFQL